MFGKISEGKIEPYTSEYVVEELLKASSPKKEQMLELFARYGIVTLGRNPSAVALADIYVASGIVPARYRTDAIHIAMATLYAMDCIVSLNFTHINRIKTKISVEAVNQLQGYGTPVICTPMELIYDGSQ